MDRIMNQALFFLVLCLSASLAGQILPLKNVVNKAKEVKKAVLTAPVPQIQPQERISLIGDLSDADEQALGRETAGRILAVHPVVADDAVQRYVNLVGGAIARQSRRSGLAWTFAVIESGDVNAFAAPGGYILITRGLYQMLQNEAELAGVIAHEIAHVNLRHHVRLMQKDRLIAKGQQFLSAQTKQDAIKDLAGTGALIATRGLDKSAEYDSDRTGLEYAARAGYDPYAYIDVLDRMGADNRADRLSLLFKTHPHPLDRINALEKAMGSKWNGVSGSVPGRWIALN